MLRKKKSLTLVGLFLILLASGLFISQGDVAAQKIRIAVMPFKLGQIERWWGWDWNPGEGISDMLVTELVNSGRFSVVERERLDEVLQEMNLAKEGVVNPATAARIGKVLGVQLFVFGTVTQFSLTSKIITLPAAGEVAEWRARSALKVRLVNVETSEIMAAVSGQGAKSQTNVALSERWGDLSGFSFGSSRFQEHILGKATTGAVKEVAKRIEEKAAGLAIAPVTPTVTPQVTVTPTVTPAKIRIAVMPFKIGQIKRWWGWDWDPGEGISDMLVTELVNSGRFSVVERERLDEVLQEQNLAREGVVNAATAARIGRVLGVQLFIFGTVTEFSLTSKITRLPILGELAEWRARSALNVRLVNVETSEIMAAITGRGAKSQTNIKLSERWGDLSGFTFGSSRFAEHILGKATTKAVEDVAEGIEEKTAGLIPVVITPEVTPEVTAPGVEGVELLISNISYGQLIEFTKVLRNIAGVREVNRRSFSEGIASLEVKATISTQELADGLYLQDFGTFEIEITRFSPRKLEIEIKEKGRVRIRKEEVPPTEAARPEVISPVKRAEEKEAEAALLPQTFSVEGIWEVTVESCEFLPGEKNLQFNLLIINLQDKPAKFEIGISFEKGAGRLARRSYLVDNLGNEYPVSKISPKGVSPFGRRQIKIIQHTPLKAHLIFPALKDEPEVVFFYGYFRGFDLTGNRWTKTTEVEIGPIKLEKAPVAKKELKVVSLPETLVTEDGNWEVTVDSYQFEEKKIEFTLLVKNLQEKIAECTIDKSGTYLLDELSEEYHNPDISKRVLKLVPHMPAKVHVTFLEFRKEAETVVLYLLFKPDQGASGDWIIGPIKLKE